jgi:hypothetical protein
MKDSDLRGIILQKYYDRRRQGMTTLAPEDFDDIIGSFEYLDVIRASEQLSEHGLIEWKSVQDHNGDTCQGVGKISAFGVDIIEGEQSTHLSINLDYSKNITVRSSSNVQIGDGNILDASTHIEFLRKAIDSSNASLEEKSQALSALKKFIKHPAVTAILGGLSATI